MAIRVTRICDTCKAEKKQIFDPREKEVRIPIGFTCSDCILEQARQANTPQHIKDLIRLRQEEANDIRMEQTLSRLETE